MGGKLLCHRQPHQPGGTVTHILISPVLISLVLRFQPRIYCIWALEEVREVRRGFTCHPKQKHIFTPLHPEGLFLLARGERVGGPLLLGNWMSGLFV